MSNLLEVMKDSLEEHLANTELEVYQASLNGADISGSCVVKLDGDGDLVVFIHIEEEELCDHISPVVMKKYLEDEGYLEDKL